MNEFGNYLYGLRRGAGMTQQELAEKLGVTNRTPLFFYTLLSYAPNSILSSLWKTRGKTLCLCLQLSAFFPENCARR